MKFENVGKAHKHGEQKRKEANAHAGVPLEHQINMDGVDPAIVSYFFALQVRLEQEGAKAGKGMDYHQYAKTMWEELIGEVDSVSEPFFRKFESSMISSLHAIDMKPIVYEHVIGNLAKLVSAYQESVAHVALWSTGDVEATGYQVGKIRSSEIIKKYNAALKASLPTKEHAGKVIREGTSYLVADDKFSALGEYVKGVMDKAPGEKIKIVMIEDSRSNFDKARKAVASTLGADANLVEIVPIWVTYSREGQQAEDKALMSTAEEQGKLFKQKKELNAVGTFEDLLDTERFGAILKDSHVFVDFDGVIGDNVAMRKEQARAIYGSLIQGAVSSSGKSEQEVCQKMKLRIEGSVQ